MSKKCKTTRKTSFPNEKRASRAMFRTWGHDPSVDIFDMHTYQCPDCKLWHFGHKSYYAKVLLKKSLGNEHINETIPTNEKF